MKVSFEINIEGQSKYPEAGDVMFIENQEAWDALDCSFKSYRAKRDAGDGNHISTMTEPDRFPCVASFGGHINNSNGSDWIECTFIYNIKVEEEVRNPHALENLRDFIKHKKWLEDDTPVGVSITSSGRIMTTSTTAVPKVHDTLSDAFDYIQEFVDSKTTKQPE